MELKQYLPEVRKKTTVTSLRISHELLQQVKELSRGYSVTDIIIALLKKFVADGGKID
jgi:hypothetical protein